MTLQQIAERRPRKIDLNLLPPEYRPAKKSKLSIILYLVTVILVCAAVPLCIAKIGVDRDIKPMKEELTHLDATISANSAVNQQAAAIQKMIDDNNSKMTVMQSSYNTVVSTRLLWSQIVSEINAITPYSKITITGLSISGTCISPTGLCPSGSGPVITFSGNSPRQQYVIDYARTLEESPFFMNVNPNSLTSGGGALVTFTITAPLDLQNISIYSK